MSVDGTLVLMVAAMVARLIFEAVMRKMEPMTLLQQYELYEKLVNSAKSDEELRSVERLRRRIHRKATRTSHPIVVSLIRVAVFCIRRLPLLCVSMITLVYTAINKMNIFHACIISCMLCSVEIIVNIASIVSSGSCRKTNGKHFRR